MPDTEQLLEKIEALSHRTSRLQKWVFFVWPVIWLFSCAAIVVTSRHDADTTKLVIQWVESLATGAFWAAILLFLFFGGIVFMLKLARDFRHRRDRFVLNPGSRKP